MHPRGDPEPRRLDADQAYAPVVAERVKDPHGVAAPAHAGDDAVRQASFLPEDLPLRFAADDALEVPDHHGVGVGARDGADDVEGVAHVGHPVPHGLVHGILQGCRPGRDGDHLGAEDFHPQDVGGLAADVLLAHENAALHPEERGHGGRGDPVLAGARLGDDAALSHPAGKQSLAEGVVDFVGARVVQVFTLQVNLRPAQLCRQVRRQVQRRLSPGVLPEVVLEFLPEGFVPAALPVRGLQLLERRHDRFGNVPPPEYPEVPFSVRQRWHLHVFVSFIVDGHSS